MGRAEVIALIVRKARQYNLVPWELLGGAIAESGLNPTAWRQGDWPDWSAGLFQQTVKFANEGDGTASAENVALIQRLYFDPVHACDVAAAKFKEWRYDPEVSALQAWCAYNLPSSYRQWPNVPNVEQRENYRAGLAEARAILGATPMPKLTYNPDFPTQIQRQDWTCSIRSVMMMLDSIGIAVTPDEAQDAMSPAYVSPAVGLLDASGAGIVEVLRDHWGVKAVNFGSLSFDEAMSMAGTGPMALGLRNWGGPRAGHWSAVRGKEDGRLVLANPAGTGPLYGQQTLSRQEFDARGPASGMFIPVAASVQPAPPVQPDEMAALRAEVAALRADLDDARSKLGVITVNYADGLDDIVKAIRALKPA